MKHENSGQIQGVASGGTPETAVLTVRLMAGEWIVENALGEAVGKGGTRDEAVTQARLIAQTQRVSGISVLGTDGALEETLEV